MAAAMGIAESFGRQLSCPTGWAGRATGMLMRILNRQCNRMAVSAVRVHAGQSVLELGCGPGEALALLAEEVPDAHLHGLDRSELMIACARARNRAAERAGILSLHHCNSQQLPFPGSSIDAVLAINVAYFWTDIGSTLREIRRVLRPGGRLVLYVTDRASMRLWSFASERTHVHWDAESLRAALIAGGFSDHEIEICRRRLRGGLHGVLAIARFSSSIREVD